MANPTRNQIIGAASSVCLLPSFILTVAPTFGRDPGNAICMALGVLALPLFPFALRRCKDAGARALVIALGMAVLLYNFSNALDAINRGYAEDTSKIRGRITDAAALNEKISELNVRKSKVDAHKIVREAEVTDAQHAKDAECKTGHGPKCRALTDALLNAQRDRAATERAEAIERALDQAQAELRALGAVEKTADQTAAQLAGVAGLFWTPAANSGEAISTNRPIFKALIVESMGGLMPWILVTIFGAAAPLPKSRSRKAKKNDPSKESVLAWHKDRVVHRAGRSVRAGVAFADYEAWCAANGQAPVNLTEFGKTVKDELGIQKTETGKRTSYVGIGLMKVVPPQDPRKTPVKGLGRMRILGKLPWLPRLMSVER